MDKNNRQHFLKQLLEELFSRKVLHNSVHDKSALVRVIFMKRKGLAIAVILALVAVVIVIIVTNKPCEATSTVMCGDNWSAIIQNGGELILNLGNKNESGEWSIVSSPEMFASDYNTPLENGIEYHIIALNGGVGEMEIHFIGDDGVVEKYILSVSISRYKKHNLQIDSVSFIEKQ